MDRLGSMVVRRPRRVVAAWVALVVLLGIVGLGLEGKLSTRAVFIEGTATEREHDIVVRQFGSENAVVVMLRGPRAEVELQGRRLERRFDAIPRTLVLTPWSPGVKVDGLMPSPRVAALVVNVKGDVNDDVLAVLPTVRRGVSEAISPPVDVSIAGAPAILESVKEANEHAAAVGQWIAIPALLIVLLLVFRSVLAALGPVIVGGAVVVASRGVLDLVASATHIELLALPAMGMMALALGVDYSLLVVSRFREEVSGGASVAEAVQVTVAATGRTVAMAGSGLSLAMGVSALVLPGAMVTSVAIAVVIATALSVLSALWVVPALLMLRGAELDRWSLPRRTYGAGLASRWSSRLAARPRLVVLPTVFILTFAAAWAFTLDTGVATVAQLPEGDPGRQQQEDVQQALGPGWVAPMEIVIEDRDGPITTADRLAALADFQRRLERDPGVATVAGFAGFERGARQLGGFERSLAAQERGLGQLGHGLSRLHEGTRLNSEGLQAAAGGAEKLHSALGATEGGAGSLAEGLGSASDGSTRLAKGLGRAGSGSGELTEGATKASQGAGRLSKGLDQAREQTGEIQSSARTLDSAMQTGEERLAEAGLPIQSVESQLAAARQSLQEMTVGRDDSEYEAALAAVEAASTWLTGIDPKTGEDSTATGGVVASVRRAQGQFDLGRYLAGQLEKNGEQAAEGMAKLARGSARLDSGLEKLVDGTREMSRGIARLSEGGQQLSPGLGRLREGAERLASGLGLIQKGAGGLSDGLAGGTQQSDLLTGAVAKMDSAIEEQQGAPGESGLDRLRRRSPGLFRSGYFYLASLDGAPAPRRQQAGYLVSLDRGGSAGRMLVVPRYDTSDPRTREVRSRLEAEAEALAEHTGAEVVVGGVAPTQMDIDSEFRDQAPYARLALALVTMVILVPVLRSLLVPFMAALLNLLTVAATFGFLALLFDGSLLGGPGYVDTGVLPATIMVVFGLAIDYEVFVFARMREEYVRTGSAKAAVADGLLKTAPVVTGAAAIMIVVFLSFAVSSFSAMRNFGVAQAIGVAIDAFLIRLIIVPVMMQALGEWAWWMPRWLDRLLPGVPNAVIPSLGGSRR